MPRFLRFMIDQYNLSCRVGFGPRKAATRAVASYFRGF